MREMTQTFTSTIISASVNKDVLASSSTKIGLKTGSTINGGKKTGKSGQTRPDSRSRTTTVLKHADTDKSFDRKAMVDKINNKVEFMYLPSYRDMRKMIMKAMKQSKKQLA